MNRNTRKISAIDEGITSILELVIAIAIIFIILSFFFVSINNFYTAYDRPDIDLQSKVFDICELLVNSPGEANDSNINWEDNPTNLRMIGFAASPLVSYGAFHLEQGRITNIIPYNAPQRNTTGLSRSCFLAGTKVLMADGTHKNIENILIGEKVKSFNDQTDTIINRTVTAVFHHSPNEMTEYYLIINQYLKVTPNHLLYCHGKWRTFETLHIGDVINTIPITSIEKVYKKVPTYNLEIEGNHNYFIYIFANTLLVHNALSDLTNVDWRPWIPVTKNAYYYNSSFYSYGTNHYVQYTSYQDNNYIYEIKEKSNYPYIVLDAQKIQKLHSSQISYDYFRSMLGLNDVKYMLYNCNITIKNETNIIGSYGESYVTSSSYVQASLIRDIVIYYKPKLIISNPGAIITAKSPYYENGQIIIRLFI